MHNTWTPISRFGRSAAIAALVASVSGLGPALPIGVLVPTALAQQAPTGFLKALDIQPATATVGATVRLTGRELPANQAVDLTWETVDGGWVIQDYYHFAGKKYSETTLSLGQSTVD